MRICLIYLLSCCLLCACGGERDAPLEVQVPAPEEQGPFQAPPPLLVGGQTEALVGTYCWGTAALAEEMGEMVMICADAVHPLDIPAHSHPYLLQSTAVPGLSAPAGAFTSGAGQCAQYPGILGDYGAGSGTACPVLRGQ